MTVMPSEKVPPPAAQEIRPSVQYYALCRICEKVWFSPYCRSEDAAKRALRKHNQDRHS